MPLAFESKSHGQVAFGFFHIETQMLLLEENFFWARDLCAWFGELARGQAPAQTGLEGWRMESHLAMGDLHGAIEGTRLHGFIGRLYGEMPFPAEESQFKQKPVPAFARLRLESIIGGFGQAGQVPLVTDHQRGMVSIGGYVFDRAGLCQLANYVWMGGMPGWLGGARPGFLEEMAAALKTGGSPWFAGCVLS